jgi:hypothetical protein
MDPLSLGDHNSAPEPKSTPRNKPKTKSLHPKNQNQNREELINGETNETQIRVYQRLQVQASPDESGGESPLRTQSGASGTHHMLHTHATHLKLLCVSKREKREKYTKLPHIHFQVRAQTPFVEDTEAIYQEYTVRMAIRTCQQVAVAK